MSRAPHILVGMSGGVDSSVTAYLLQQEHAIAGAFMKNWHDDNDPHCPAAQDLHDAQQVANQLGIELSAVQFIEDYWHQVFSYCLDQYSQGFTPNPDVLCNQMIKFRCFLDYAQQQGMNTIATGHYARIRYQNGQAQLLRAKDRHKDQSYFLHRLDQQQLQCSLFPLGEYSKTEVRRIAQQHAFSMLARKTAQAFALLVSANLPNF